MAEPGPRSLQVLFLPAPCFSSQRAQGRSPKPFTSFAVSPSDPAPGSNNNLLHLYNEFTESLFPKCYQPYQLDELGRLGMTVPIWQMGSDLWVSPCSAPSTTRWLMGTGLQGALCSRAGSLADLSLRWCPLPLEDPFSGVEPQRGSQPTFLEEGRHGGKACVTTYLYYPARPRQK